MQTHSSSSQPKTRCVAKINVYNVYKLVTNLFYRKIVLLCRNIAIVQITRIWQTHHVWIKCVKYFSNLGKRSATWYSTAYISQTRDYALYHLGSGSWLAWANDTAAHYAAIHCPPCRTIGPAVSQTDIPPPQSATLGLHLAARKPLLMGRSSYSNIAPHDRRHCTALNLQVLASQRHIRQHR